MTPTSFGKLQRLEGKVVLVTGATGILGQRFCEGYAELGASVALVDLDAALCRKTARGIEKRYGSQAVGVGCDITCSRAVDAMVHRVMDVFGHIDVLHNNAATKGHNLRAFFAPFEKYSLDVWREVMAVNIDGMFLVAQRVGQEMIVRGCGGSVIQTSSIYGLVGADPRIYKGSRYLGGPINTPAVYATSKAAVVGLTRHLATHWAVHSIRVNCLVPGGVESGQNREFKKRYSERVPLRRMARAEEIVSAALFLASDASSYVTGQVLAVDGGFTAW
ncbi:MAG: SDR family oxidoreductase [Pseudomonadota bacterium]